MTIKESQELVDAWIRKHGVRYFNELTNMIVLTEEVGELARVMARRYGEQSSKESDEKHDLADEIADVMWVLIAIANQTEDEMTATLTANLEKKNRRDGSRHKENPRLK